MTRHHLVSLLLSGLAGATAIAQEPHPAGHVPAPQAAAPAATPLYTDSDLMFLTHMIVHHQQAIDMAALVPGRTDRQELLTFARHVAGAQQSEIDHMKALLQAAADRGQAAPHHEMTGDPPMRGLLSKAQLAELKEASGAEFTRLWLQGMIQHHQGAVEMSLAQQQREFESGRRPYGIAPMADDILTTQRGEIAIMKAWLFEWGPADSVRNR